MFLIDMYYDPRAADCVMTVSFEDPSVLSGPSGPQAANLSPRITSAASPALAARAYGAGPLTGGPGATRPTPVSRNTIHHHPTLPHL